MAPSKTTLRVCHCRKPFDAGCFAQPSVRLIPSAVRDQNPGGRRGRGRNSKRRPAAARRSPAGGFKATRRNPIIPYLVREVGGEVEERRNGRHVLADRCCSCAFRAFSSFAGRLAKARRAAVCCPGVRRWSCRKSMACLR